MTRLRRRPRTVYRVYDEDEYLAGADAYVDWDAAPAQPDVPPARCDSRTVGASRERRLRRLAGAAALSGAVGTVGGTIALAGLRSHAGDRRLAASVSSPARIAQSGGGRSGIGVGSGRVALRRDAARRSGADRDGERWYGAHPQLTGDRRAVRLLRALHTGADAAQVASNARVSESASTTPVPESRPAHDAPVPVEETRQDTPVPVASAAQDTPAPAAGPRAQSEFGFER